MEAQVDPGFVDLAAALMRSECPGLATPAALLYAALAGAAIWFAGEVALYLLLRALARRRHR